MVGSLRNPDREVEEGVGQGVEGESGVEEGAGGGEHVFAANFGEEEDSV